MTGRELDQRLGSLLEQWYTRDTAGCRFCNETVDDDEEYCSDECERRADKVLEARLALGKRDMNQRGYD